MLVLWNTLFPIPEGMNRMVTYFENENINNKSDLITLNNTNFESASVIKLNLKERVKCAEWFYKQYMQKNIDYELYRKFCENAWPQYKSNEDESVMVYWQDFREQVIETSEDTNDMWLIEIDYILRHSAMYNCELFDVVGAFKQLTLNRKLFISKVINTARNSTLYCKLDRLPLIRNALNKVIYQILLHPEDGQQDFKTTFIGEGIKLPLTCELRAKDLFLANLGVKYINTLHATDEDDVLVQNRRSFQIITKDLSRITSDAQKPLWAIHIPVLRYVHIKTNIKSRIDVKELNQLFLFPYTSKQDKNHMTTNVASLIFSYICGRPGNPYYNERTKMVRIYAINKILRYIAVGTNQVLVLSILIAALGHRSKDMIYQQILQTGMLYHGDTDKRKLLKYFSIAIRRTQRLYNNTILKADDISALCYYELAFGRSNNVSDWQQEIINRCTKTQHIQLKHINTYEKQQKDGSKHYHIEWRTEEEINDKNTKSDDAFYYALQDKINEILQKIMIAVPKDEDFETFLKRRSEWCVAGASGGVKIAVPDLVGLANESEPRPNIKYVAVGKRAAMEKMSTADLLFIMQCKPTEFAKASEKIENGKSRSIYGVLMAHYILSSRIF